MKTTAILLAAGLSSRMGRNKMLLPFQQTIIVQHTYNQLIKSEVHEVIIVGGNGFEDLSTSLQLRETDQLVYNKDYETGMTSSIQAGVERATGDAYMICLGDMPSLNGQHYVDLIEAFNLELFKGSQNIVLPSVKGKKGNPVIFSNYYRSEILNHKEPNGCKSVIKRNKDHLIKFESDQVEYLTDIDTPKDYQRLIHGTE